MAWHDWGNAPINSTGFAQSNGGSTSTLLAELDSTQLGTVNLAVGQKKIAKVTWIVGGDTNTIWALETATSTALSAGADVILARTPTAQTAQYVTVHELFKDYRIRARLNSTNGGSCAAFISAEFLT